MIIGISGLCIDSKGNKVVAGAGKDTVADILYVHRHVAKVALADPLKRICQQVYGFTYEQLWGPSHFRNAPDKRYVRMKAGALGTMGFDKEDAGMPNPMADVYLTPRHALQQLGTEWGRKCCDDTWIDLGIRVANALTSDPSKMYIDHRGVLTRDMEPGDYTEEELEEHENTVDTFPSEIEHVAFSDVRFFNEQRAIKAAGGKVIRVKRVLDVELADPLELKHSSELELSTADDDEFDYVLENNSSIDVLKLNVHRMYDVLTGRIMEYDEAQADVPPFMRNKP